MPNMDDMFGADDFAEFFGGFAGPHGRRQQQGPPPKVSKTEDAHIDIEVTLEELYKGKVYKMNSIRDVLCKTCSGRGCKPKAKESKCKYCNGQGMRKAMRRVGPGLVTQDFVPCEHCHGKGFSFREKDRCKRCHGKSVVEEKSVLEVYVPPGSKDGHQIVLEGKADEEYGKKAGNLVFTVRCKEHAKFIRKQNDLYIEVKITLAEALCGFSRVLCTHLDGRGIQVTSPAGKVIRPRDYLQVKGEGMPIKSIDTRGDLYLLVDIIFPENGWCVEKSELRVIQDMLPTQAATINAKEVDDVDYKVMHGELPEYDHDDDDDDNDDGYEYGGGAPPECAQM